MPLGTHQLFPGRGVSNTSFYLNANPASPNGHLLPDQAAPPHPAAPSLPNPAAPSYTAALGAAHCHTC